jgi:hypothetical protein
MLLNINLIHSREVAYSNVEMKILSQKNPWISALLNFLIWGGGYIYNGKRRVLGLGLILVAAFEHSPLLFIGLDLLLTFPYTSYVIGHILLSSFLAYDAYNEALQS